jgi:hypothetical protein
MGMQQTTTHGTLVNKLCFPTALLGWMVKKLFLTTIGNTI